MKTGKPCMDLLDEPSCWSENVQGVQYILLSIQVVDVFVFAFFTICVVQ